MRQAKIKAVRHTKQACRKIDGLPRLHRHPAKARFQFFNLIGKEIESKGNTGVVTGGQGAFSYILPKAANSAEITITNSIGQVVFRGNGDTKSGRNIVVWDGKNSTTGKQEPDGTYKIAINALDPAGKAILAETRSVATVTGVETDSAGNTLLSAGNGTINFNDVLAVRAISRANL
jgi:flagellar basal-body rod modification protein FlgD